jgi:hypothetical protein
MNAELSTAVKAFRENLKLIHSQQDPVMYNLNAGMLALAQGIAKLRDSHPTIRSSQS